MVGGLGEIYFAVINNENMMNNEKLIDKLMEIIRLSEEMEKCALNAGNKAVELYFNVQRHVALWILLYLEKVDEGYDKYDVLIKKYKDDISCHEKMVRKYEYYEEYDKASNLNEKVVLMRSVVNDLEKIKNKHSCL